MSGAFDDFRAGVTACLRSWSALRTAVEAGWGGGTKQSLEKGENLRQSILDTMNGSAFPIPNFDIHDLGDNLAIYMEEEFSVTLEDNSEMQVAETIFRMYEECSKGNVAFAREIVARAESAVSATSQIPTQVQSGENDDDSDDEMVDSGDQQTAEVEATAYVTANGLSPAEYAAAPLFGKIKESAAPTGPVRQLGEAAPEPETIQVDEDGFAPVKPKGKRRN